jgi:hypothetical protein
MALTPARCRATVATQGKGYLVRYGQLVIIWQFRVYTKLSALPIGVFYYQLFAL